MTEHLPPAVITLTRKPDRLLLEARQPNLKSVTAKTINIFFDAAAENGAKRRNAQGPLAGAALGQPGPPVFAPGVFPVVPAALPLPVPAPGVFPVVPALLPLPLPVTPLPLPESAPLPAPPEPLPVAPPGTKGPTPLPPTPLPAPPPVPGGQEPLPPPREVPFE